MSKHRHSRDRGTHDSHSNREVEPLLATSWGQSGVWKQGTPQADGEPTYPGCTTIASAQILYYYQYKNHASSDVCYRLDHDVTGADVEDGVLCLYFDSDDIQYDWDSMARSELDSLDAIHSANRFIYHVGVTLNAQFGGGEGSSATGRQIENAFRDQWGFIKRRDGGLRSKSVKVILKDEFFRNDDDFAEHLRMELDAGRPVMYMAQLTGGDVGHAFVIDGYRGDDEFHVNWGWGGTGNGYYDLTMTDPSGRSWTRNALIYQYLEPLQDYSLSITPRDTQHMESTYSWNGNGSLISYTSGDATGYGLTIDEAAIHPDSPNLPAVFFQWEIDQKDGTKLKIDVDGLDKATITYGFWSDRSQDITYEDVDLPYIIDPAKDGFPASDQEYYVIAVRFDTRPESITSVIAEITSEESDRRYRPSTGVGFEVDGASWQGNGSLISYSSGSKTGYGLDRDESLLATSSSAPPVVYFQWEVDGSDGKKLTLTAGDRQADITYGVWNDRSADVTHTDVSLPYVLDPGADGLSTADGEYYVIRMNFKDSPAEAQPVEAFVTD